jgi:enoyl-CoA hydratase
MSPRTHVSVADGIARISLDDGKVNAMSLEMIEAIGRALDVAEKAGAVTVIRGRAGVFSAGFDLTTFSRGPLAAVAMVGAGARLVERLLSFPRPVLTVCTGHAYPMGAFVMLASDVRFGLAGPWRIGLNETAIGLTLPKFAVELARHRLTPPGLARVATAQLFGPDEAARLGYLDRVLAGDELDAAVDAEAARLRALDMPSFEATKARIHAPLLRAVRAAIAEELATASNA